MGFLDSLRDRFAGNAGDDDDYYEDDYYEDDSAGYAPESRRRDTGSATRLLGNTPRPEAESVSVYTRSGRPQFDYMIDVLSVKNTTGNDHRNFGIKHFLVYFLT